MGHVGFWFLVSECGGVGLDLNLFGKPKGSIGRHDGPQIRYGGFNFLNILTHT